MSRQSWIGFPSLSLLSKVQINSRREHQRSIVDSRVQIQNERVFTGTKPIHKSENIIGKISYERIRTVKNILKCHPIIDSKLF